eukprot:CAMPEP_0115162654 /NCGR_PEP_ID=MMETSP0227-20121206/72076_1 /TAXON_ID=89957 /ORGANISM="Polarella glacialis, Strain CCMP 1383" /LENGTH=306 /DNA_ID=CAMNT_0002574877 /DNA_START=115 /DNA_END=1031 /DNA_ORIENTATION=-
MMRRPDGLEFWRSGPPEEPADKFGDSEADFARGILDRRLPLRSLALLFLPPEVMPCVGQQVEVLIDSSSSKGALQLAILDYGTSFNGGLVACVPELEGASGNPWGGTAAELLDLVRLDGPEALVRLRGVSSVRLVAHQPANEVTISVTTALLQEVPEYADGLLSLEAGQKLEADVQELEGLFAQCGEMQRRSGLTAAGDFVSKTLMQREADVLETLKGVPLLCSESWGAGAEVQRVRRAAAVVHALVAALSVQIRTRFMCDPEPLFPKMRHCKSYLTKVHGLLCARLALRRVFEEGDASPPGSEEA